MFSLCLHGISLGTQIFQKYAYSVDWRLLTAPLCEALMNVAVL